MNAILKNEDFLLKLEERIIDKLADKIVDKVITDQDFSMYLQQEPIANTSTETKKDAIYNPPGNTNFQEFLGQLKKPDVEDVLKGLRSVGTLDRFPGNVGNFAPKSFSEFMEKKKASNPSTETSDITPGINGPKPYYAIETDETKVDATMDKFENSIKKLIEQGSFSGIKNLSEFYDKVDRILKKLHKYNTFSTLPGEPSASAEDRDELHYLLYDARALSTFSSRSEAAAEALFMERINSDRFNVNQKTEDDNIQYYLTFDVGSAIVEDNKNLETGHREMKIKDLVLFDKIISDFKLSDNKLRDLVDILEHKMLRAVLNPHATKESTKNIAEERKVAEEKKAELEKQKVKFMSPEFLQAVI